MRLLGVFLIFVFAGCHTTTDKRSQLSTHREAEVGRCEIENRVEDIEVSCEDGKIVYSNQTGKDVYMFAAGKVTQQKIRWAPTVFGDPALKPGEKKVFEYPEQWVNEGGAGIYFWHAVEGRNGKMQAGPVSGVSLKFVTDEAP